MIYLYTAILIAILREYDKVKSLLDMLSPEVFLIMYRRKDKLPREHVRESMDRRMYWRELVSGARNRGFRHVQIQSLQFNHLPPRTYYSLHTTCNRDHQSLEIYPFQPELNGESRALEHMNHSNYALIKIIIE